MTAPAPVPPPLNAPLTTIDELAVWIRQPIAEDQQDFAYTVLEAVAVVIREAGSQWWVHGSTDPMLEKYVIIPYRAKLIADLKAKNFYEHPTGAISETVGPLSERYLDEVVTQIVLSDEEKAILADLAAAAEEGTGPNLQGIWALSTTRGQLETHPKEPTGTIHVPYWRPYWPYDSPGGSLPYYKAGALGSPE